MIRYFCYAVYKHSCPDLEPDLLTNIILTQADVAVNGKVMIFPARNTAKALHKLATDQPLAKLTGNHLAVEQMLAANRLSCRRIRRIPISRRRGITTAANCRRLAGKNILKVSAGHRR